MASLANGSVGIVIDLATFNCRHPLIQQASQLAKNPALRLAPSPEKNKVGAREQVIEELRDDRMVVACDARKYCLPLFEFRDQILAHLVFHRPMMKARFVVLAALKLADC